MLGWVVEVWIGGVGGDALNVHKFENEHKYVYWVWVFSISLILVVICFWMSILSLVCKQIEMDPISVGNTSESSSSMLQHPKKILIDTKPNVVLCPLLAKQTQMQQEWQQLLAKQKNSDNNNNNGHNLCQWHPQSY
jgi:hypothetical protein